MYINNPIVRLCMEGSRAEFEGSKTDAFNLYMKAWESRTNDYEACISAHYVARFQETPEDILHWNKTALAHADCVKDGSVNTFYPSLYLNMGKALENYGEPEEAKLFFGLAVKAGQQISESHGEMIATAIYVK